MKCFQSKIQIPHLGTQRPKAGLVLTILSTLLLFNAPYVLTTPATSLFPNIHIKHLPHSVFRLITGILFSLSYPHLCHQSKPYSFSSQMIRATWGLSKIAGKFEHFYFLSEFCLHVLATHWQII